MVEYLSNHNNISGGNRSEDDLVYEDRENLQRFHSVRVSEDERFAFLYISERGKGKKGNAVFYRDLSKGEQKFTPIIANIGDDSFGVIDSVGDKFLIQTNRKAPNNRVFLFDPQNPDEKNWKEIISEKAEPLEDASTAGGKLFTSYLKDVTTRVYVHDLNGRFENEVKLPAIGSAGGFGGERDDKFVFYTFTSFNYPPAIFRYDIATRRSSLFRAAEIPDFRPSDYETRQVFYKSKDGTRVPMFLVYKKGLKLDGSNPTLLYGYGGFNITTSPSFTSFRLAQLEQGFVYASANIRGGGEYGENRERPVLIRIDTKSGHGASSTMKSIEQTADIYSFLFLNLGVTPKYERLAAR
jgi:prolyl oligopeptidase